LVRLWRTLTPGKGPTPLDSASHKSQLGELDLGKGDVGPGSNPKKREAPRRGRGGVGGAKWHGGDPSASIGGGGYSILDVHGGGGRGGGMFREGYPPSVVPFKQVPSKTDQYPGGEGYKKVAGGPRMARGLKSPYHHWGTNTIVTPHKMKEKGERRRGEPVIRDRQRHEDLQSLNNGLDQGGRENLGGGGRWEKLAWRTCQPRTHSVVARDN